MMDISAQTSVIIVSRHRPEALQRCITALRQQDHNRFEVIVVADPAAISNLDAQNDIKKIMFDQPNIAAARNLGLMAAASDLVAFIDDDAVAEPTWLSRLTDPFDNPNVIAATGFVRGRNGISFQWCASAVDHFGNDHPLDVSETTILPATPKRAVKTQGTNCAFRTDTLRAIGGFDPAFRFYLDEADVNLRLAQSGLTAIVPNAQVHHGFFESAYRSADRVPKSLFEIGRSVAVFLRRHAGDPQITDIATKQQSRLNALRAAGKITSQQADELRATLYAGWHEGLACSLRGAEVLPKSATVFLGLGGIGPRCGQVLSGRVWSRKKLMHNAKIAVEEGHIVTVICLSPTPKAHWMQFTKDGFWLQTGGIWGRSNRQMARFIWGGFDSCVRREIALIQMVRPIA